MAVSSQPPPSPSSPPPSSSVKFDAKLALLLCVLLQSFLVSGLVFGWPSLSVILKKEGIFSNDCANTTASSTNSSSICNSQEKELVAVFQAGFITQFASRLLLGFLLDSYGPRVASNLGAVSVVLGLILFAISDSSPSSSPTIDAFIPANFLMGLGGPGIHFSNFHISNLFGPYKNTALSAVSGIFSASGIMFYFFYLLYIELGYSHRTLFFGYTVLVVVYFLLTCRFQPKRPYKLGDKIVFNWRRWEFQLVPESNVMQLMVRATAIATGPATGSASAAVPAAKEPSPEDMPSGPAIGAEVATTHTEAFEMNERHRPSAASVREVVVSQRSSLASTPVEDTLSQSVSAAGSLTALNQSPSSASSAATVPGSVREKFPHLRALSFRQQLLSRQFWAVTAFMCFALLQMQFYLGTSRPQLEGKGDSSNSYNSVFNVIGAVGFVFLPLSGFILDGYGGYPMCFFLTLLCSAVFNFSNAFVTSLPAQIYIFVLWSLARFLMFTAFFGVISDMFGFKNFGKLAGFASLVSSLFCLLTYPLTSLCLDTLDKEFWQLHTVFGCIMVVGMLFPLYMRGLYMADRRAAMQADSMAA